MRTTRRFRLISSAAVLALLGVFACANIAFADGGRVRFRQPAGPFVVTLFTTPDPLTKGPADFSVAVERAGAEGLVQDADVDLILTPADGHGTRLVLHASHAAATSKWLQAVNFQIPRSGVWRVTVMVHRGAETGECSGDVRVRTSETSDLAWDVLPVPLAVLFFALHEALKRKHNRDRRSRQLAQAEIRRNAV
jgi:hypothetical protein